MRMIAREEGFYIVRTHTVVLVGSNCIQINERHSFLFRDFFCPLPKIVACPDYPTLAKLVSRYHGQDYRSSFFGFCISYKLPDIPTICMNNFLTAVAKNKGNAVWPGSF